ncbi:MAG: hypothetical protein HYV07_14590 [Deltaproteobacteria bacterium]|nr:hypothetical protein [Deltaproteobacteria bacterium]
MAALFFSDDSLVAASALVPAADARELTVPSDAKGAEAIAIGFGDEVARVPGLTELTGAGHLRVARGCDPRLPNPRWVSDGRFVEALTLPGLELRCPADWAETHVAEVRCAISPCAAVIRQAGCKVSVELGDCGAAVRAELQADWQARACPVANDGCGPLEPTADPYGASLVCPGFRDCELRIHPRGGERPGWTRAALSLSEPPRFVPPRGEGGWPGEGAVASSSLHDFVDFSDQVLVVASRVVEPTACASGQSVLFAIDGDRFSVTNTSTLPPCLRNMARDPNGEGFVATFRGASGFELGRFDLDGRLRTRVQLPEPEGLAATRVFLLDATPSRILVLASKDDLTNPALYSVFLDPRSLAPRLGPIVAARPRAYSMPDANRILIADSWVDRVLVLDRNRGDEIGSLKANVQDLDFSAVLEVGSHTLVGAVSWVAAVLDLDALHVERARHPELMSMPTRFLADPSGDRILVALSTGPGIDPTAHLAWLDLARFEFEPGYVHVGEGVVSGILQRPDGSLWTFLGWTGEVVRLLPPNQ